MRARRDRKVTVTFRSRQFTRTASRLGGSPGLSSSPVQVEPLDNGDGRSVLDGPYRLQHVAHVRENTGVVLRAGPFPANHTIAIEHEYGAPARLFKKAQRVVVEAGVVRDDLPVEVAKQGELDVEILGEGLVREEAVHADREDLGASLLEFGCLVSKLRQLVPSRSTEIHEVKEQDHLALPKGLLQADFFVAGLGNGEVGRAAAHFKVACHGEPPRSG